MRIKRLEWMKRSEKYKETHLGSINAAHPKKSDPVAVANCRRSVSR